MSEVEVEGRGADVELGTGQEKSSHSEGEGRRRSLVVEEALDETGFACRSNAVNQGANEHGRVDAPTELMDDARRN